MTVITRSQSRQSDAKPFNPKGVETTKQPPFYQTHYREWGHTERAIATATISQAYTFD